MLLIIIHWIPEKNLILCYNPLAFFYSGTLSTSNQSINQTTYHTYLLLFAVDKILYHKQSISFKHSLPGLLYYIVHFSVYPPYVHVSWQLVFIHYFHFKFYFTTDKNYDIILTKANSLFPNVIIQPFLYLF